MGLLRGVVERRSSLANPEKWLLRAFGAEESYTGRAVDQDAALRLSAVHACVKILSETVATLPFPVYRRLEPRGRERAREHPLYELLHDRPNPEMTAMQWRECQMLHLLLWGNAFSEVELNGAGRPVALWPLLPDRTWVVRKDGARVVVTRLASVEIGLPAETVLHIPGLGYNGLMGFSPIRYAMQAVGLGLAAEEFEARFFGRGMRPSGWIEYPQAMTKEQRKELAEQVAEVHGGVGSMHKTAVFDRGLKYHPTQVNAVDAQLLETRKFSVREVARFFNVPSYLLQDTEPGASYASIEQRAIDFVRFTVRPWLVRIEQAVNRALVSGAERGEVFAEFLVDGLLRGDFQTRMQGYATARQWGWLSANDIRELENMNPLPGEEGETYLVPLNMVPAGEAGAFGAGPSEGPAPQLEEGASVRGRGLSGALGTTKVEGRAVGFVVLRRRVQRAFAPVVKDAAQRAVRREVEAGRKAAKAHLTDGASFSRELFLEWVERFYPEQREYMAKQMQPVVEALSGQVAAVALEEVGAGAEVLKQVQDGMGQFAAAYAANVAVRHAASSSGQLRQVAGEAERSKAAALVEERLAEWESNTAEKVAGRETVEAGAAAALVAFRAAGVTRFTWQTLGANCPLCEELNGKVVGVQQNFAGPGDVIDPDDGVTAPLKVKWNISHPPLHEGCDCMVGAG